MLKKSLSIHTNRFQDTETFLNFLFGLKTCPLSYFRVMFSLFIFAAHMDLLYLIYAS